MQLREAVEVKPVMQFPGPPFHAGISFLSSFEQIKDDSYAKSGL